MVKKDYSGTDSNGVSVIAASANYNVTPINYKYDASNIYRIYVRTKKAGGYADATNMRFYSTNGYTSTPNASTCDIKISYSNIDRTDSAQKLNMPELYIYGESNATPLAVLYDADSKYLTMAIGGTNVNFRNIYLYEEDGKLYYQSKI